MTVGGYHMKKFILFIKWMGFYCGLLMFMTWDDIGGKTHEEV